MDWLWGAIIAAGVGAGIFILKRKGKKIAFGAGLSLSKILITRFGAMLAGKIEDVIDFVGEMFEEFRRGMNSDNGAAKPAKKRGKTGKEQRKRLQDRLGTRRGS